MPENTQTASEKGRGKAIHEIIIDSERPSSVAQNQVSRILDEQTELIAKKLTKSQLDALLAESQRKEEEEKIRFKQLSEGQASPSTQPTQDHSEAKTILDAVRIGVEVAKPQNQPQGSISDIAKSMAEMFKTGVEVGRGQTQSQQPQQDPMQIYKVVTEMIRPFQEDARAREKEANELRYRALESKIINPVDYIKNAKAMASELGLTGGSKTEMDLKLEEMKQNRETDNRKIDLEEKKWEYEKQNEGKTLDTVKEILEGPVGDVIKNIGGAGADRVRGGSPKVGNMTQVQCPSCRGVFMANPNLAVIGCPNCGAKLEKQQVSPTPPIIPEPVPQTQPEQPKPEQLQPTGQVEITDIVDLNRR